MSEYSSLIHQPVRLRIMASLTAMDRDQKLNFVDLRGLLKLTDGNLGAHLHRLEEAGYISIEKAFEGLKPCTWVKVTNEGVAAFEAHVQYLKEIVGQLGQ